MTGSLSMKKRIAATVVALLLAAGVQAQTRLHGRIEHVDPQARIVVVDGTEYTVSAGAPVHGTPSEPGRLEDLEAGMHGVLTVLEPTPGSHRGLITKVVVHAQ